MALRRFHLCGMLLIAYLITDCCSLKDVRVIIPHAAVRGSRALLQCHYDLETDQLYSVKWYKGQREFYRYTLRDNPPIKQFPIDGLRVLLAASNSTHLTLDNVTMENTGVYNCEISADAPSFFTGMQNGTLQVVDIPKHDPNIIGLKPRYKNGDMLKAECISRESAPAANLTWLVNDEPAQPVHIRHNPSRRNTSSSLLTAFSRLRLTVTKDLFARGSLKIRCIATVMDVYYKSAEKSVDMEKPKPTPRSLSSPTPSEWDFSFPEQIPRSTYVSSATTSGVQGSSAIAHSYAVFVVLLPPTLLILRIAINLHVGADAMLMAAR